MLLLLPLLIRLRVFFVRNFHKREITIFPDLIHDFLSHSLGEVGIDPEEQLNSGVLEGLEGYLLLHHQPVVPLLVVRTELHDVVGGHPLVVSGESPFQLSLVLLLLVLADLSF